MAITITGNGESGKGIGEWGMGISCYYNCYTNYCNYGKFSLQVNISRIVCLGRVLNYFLCRSSPTFFKTGFVFFGMKYNFVEVACILPFAT
jgi:hypothetical protein